MCGIFCLLNNDNTWSQDFIIQQFSKGSGRGPEFSKLQTVHKNTLFGFHRLAINGLDSESNQPLSDEKGLVYLICNGEIYNYKELYKMMGVTPKTNSDCEVIIHLYKRYGIEQTLQMLDGVFAFALYDFYGEHEQSASRLFLARDPYGVRPLYSLFKESSATKSSANHYVSYIDREIFGFASELKVLSDFTNEMPGTTIEQFLPGTYTEVEISAPMLSMWVTKQKNVRYHIPAFSKSLNKSLDKSLDKSLNKSLNKSLTDKSLDKNSSLYPEWVIEGVQRHLVDAVRKRCLTTDRPIACLLSGGLDSSLITALVNDEHKRRFGADSKLETYSIGLSDSEDIKFARIVADYLGTKHTEIIVTEDQMFDVIPEVIQAIESYDTTTVRASIGNYLLGKHICLNSEAKVIFNGDGSDELCGGYLYMYKCPDLIEFDKESRRLLKDIYLFDVLRSDKCISSHGLEPRTPFLDKSWVNFYLSLSTEYRFHVHNNVCEKHLLRTAFSHAHFKNSLGKSLLPDTILWRTKEAFSDGVSKHGRSLYEIIQEKVKPELLKMIEKESSPSVSSIDDMDLLINVCFNVKETGNLFQTINQHLPPDYKKYEQIYYRMIFEKSYGGKGSVLPYFWMPKYVAAGDASARTLDIYSEINKTTIDETKDLGNLDKTTHGFNCRCQ